MSGLVTEWATLHQDELLANWTQARAQQPLAHIEPLEERTMMSQIVEAYPLEGYRLRLRFADGVEGVVEVQKLVPFEGVFAPLREGSFFAQVQVHPELMTVFWPNGADLDPDVLYSVVTGVPVEGRAAVRERG